MEKDLTILIPALNEEKTIEIVIKKAEEYIKSKKINGEILIANNRSIDKTKELAMKLGARVVDIETKGYGITIIEGIKNANGNYIIIGDADDSYNFLELDDFVQAFNEGYDIVIGNRYGKVMEKGSMKISHKYIGTPILGWLIRKKYKKTIHDINCGLRGGKKEKLINLDCNCDGMEFASEMMIKAIKKNMKIKEVPINFYKDKREGKSHLNAIRDGIKHLKVILF